MVSKVSRPRRDADSGFRIRWTDSDGKRQSKSFRTKDEAEAYRMMLMAMPAPAEAIASDALDLDRYDGSASWWDKAHGWLATEVLRAVAAGNAHRVEWLKDACGALAGLARSQLGHRDWKRIEDELAELKAFRATLMTAQRTGTRLMRTPDVTTQ